MQYANTRAKVASVADPPMLVPSVYDLAILEELQFVRRAAQAEANTAYRDWSLRPSRDGYAVYRAAQDRADAAQDELTSWARSRLTASSSA